MSAPTLSIAPRASRPREDERAISQRDAPGGAVRRGASDIKALGAIFCNCGHQKRGRCLAVAGRLAELGRDLIVDWSPGRRGSVWLRVRVLRARVGFSRARARRVFKHFSGLRRLFRASARRRGERERVLRGGFEPRFARGQAPLGGDEPMIAIELAHDFDYPVDRLKICLSAWRHRPPAAPR